MPNLPSSAAEFLPWLREHAHDISIGDAAIALEILRDRLFLPAVSNNLIADGARVVFTLRGTTIHGVVAHTSGNGIASVEVRRHDGGLERMKVPVSRLRSLAPETGDHQPR